MKDPAAIGFRVKTGWTVAVLLEGPVDSPVVLDHRHVQLSDPDVPESRQPFHAGFGTAETDVSEIARLQGLVERFARGALSKLIRGWARDRRLEAAGLVVGSLVDPQTIGNQHMRAHACEGQLYRCLIEDAVRHQEIPSRVISERDLFATAEHALGWTAAELRATLKSLRPAGPGPWRAEEKAATLAAWLTFATTRRPSGSFG